MTTSSDAEQYALTTKERARLGWMALALTPEMGPTRIARAMARLGGEGAAERVFEASLTELEGAGLPAQAAQFVFEGRAFEAAEDEAKRVAEAGGFFLTREDEAYPRRLLEIYDPPAVLWVRGNAELLARPGIAVVGTRQPSPYGSGMAEMLARDLANRGLVILSGMARGVDSAAHKGALDAGGKTAAVWGTGIDVVYPKENKKLAERIVQSGGTIVSEFPLGTFPAPQNFPAAQPDSERDEHRRAGGGGGRVFGHADYGTLRDGTESRCVCGAGKRDQQECLGAEHADQARREADGDVGGCVGGPAVECETGTRSSRWELQARVNRMGPDLHPYLTTPTTGRFRSMSGLVLDRLRRDESMQLDDLIEGLEAQLGSAEIFTALFELELRGRVKQLPGKNYVRCF